MLNLLGCNKENFLKLVKNMGYKNYKKENEIYFKYVPTKRSLNDNSNYTKNIHNPFNVLKKLTLNK
jgi:ATP-dependent RNA helicase SUPV3L1/SUV3